MFLGESWRPSGAQVQVGEGFLYLPKVQGGTVSSADAWPAEALLPRELKSRFSLERCSKVLKQHVHRVEGENQSMENF